MQGSHSAVPALQPPLPDLLSVAACVIGGINMAGGEGKVYNAIIGALIIGFLRNALNLIGLHPYYQNLIVGVLIISIVASGYNSLNVSYNAFIWRNAP